MKSSSARPGGRPLTSGVLGLALVAVLAGCGDGSGGSAKGPYQVGVVVDQSGPVRSVSAPQLVGIKAAIAAANDAGGVNGHKIELVVRDDASDAAKGVAAFRELVDRYEVSAVTGFTSSTSIPGVVNFAQQSKVAMLAAGAPGDLLDPVNPVVFSTNASINAQGTGGVDYLKSLTADGRLPAEPKLALFSYSSPAGESWRSAVEPYAKAQGFDIVTEQTAAVGSASYSAAMQAITASEPDAVLVTAAETDLINMAKSLQASGLDPRTPVVNYSFGSGASVLRAVADLGLEHYVASAPFDADGDAAGSKAYADAVTKAGGDPATVMVPEGYAQGRMVVEVLEKCGYPCPADTFLKTVNAFDSDLDGFAFGPVVFDAAGHAGPTTVAFRTWDAKKKAPTTVKGSFELAGASHG
ncbi:ABC transporter substrate-binding protein [Streptomyces abyssomicinicus]|uniref:ABC transporter substrate-binding protein n=1 Tax=Streptomyces abyssomicinicus TaxID=574929 RepID=UPI0012503F7B|nr:ABC transporter substrate-binding protein [Streptomyces abyssomicinicus]